MPINQLTSSVESLTHLFVQLNQENKQLHIQLKQVQAEKIALSEKNHQATIQIKQIMQKIREEIHERIST